MELAESGSSAGVISRPFRLGSLGGKATPWLDAATLDRLADALGYFQSAQPSTILDVPASIKATTSKGGMPSLVFQRRPQLRRVLILEDTLAQGRKATGAGGRAARVRRDLVRSDVRGAASYRASPDRPVWPGGPQTAKAGQAQSCRA